MPIGLPDKMSELHRRLVDRQPIGELIRKADKARSRQCFTQEDVDLAQRAARKYADLFVNKAAPEQTT